MVGLIWVAAWLVWGKEGPLVETAATAAAEPRIPYFQLLTSRTFIGCCAATFGAYWALSLGLTWFTPFIVKGLGFSQTDAGWISILPWVFGAVIVILTGWISQVMMARGFTTRGARGVLGSVPLIVGGCILATCLMSTARDCRSRCWCSAPGYADRSTWSARRCSASSRRCRSAAR